MIMKRSLICCKTLRPKRHISSAVVSRSQGTLNNEFLDSSIITMEQILGILHAAHGSKLETRESALNAFEVDPHVFKNKLLTSLGEDVFDFITMDVLLALQLQHGIDVFKDSTQDHTKTILQRYIFAFKSHYSRKSSPMTMNEIGKNFKECPQETKAKLSNTIKRTALSALGELPHAQTSAKIYLDFCRVKLYNPFRNGTVDPFSIRKGLSTDNHPENLFGVIINDQTVISSFLRSLHRRTPSTVLLNMMIVQSFIGNSAFKIAAKRIMVDLDPKRTINTPFEHYHLSTSDELGSMKILKAVAASRSMILKRLFWFPPYRHSLGRLEPSKYDSREKIIDLMADLFDRFYGVCYKVDAKYSQQWILGLVELYANYEGGDFPTNRLLEECIADFKSTISGINFKTFEGKWLQSECSVWPYTKRAQSSATRRLLKETRAVIFRSTDSKSTMKV